MRRNLYPVLTAPTETGCTSAWNWLNVPTARRAPTIRACSRSPQLTRTICDTCWWPTSAGVLNLRSPAAGAIERVGAGAARDGPPQSGYDGGGGRVELSFFCDVKTPEQFAHEAARQAIAQLDAVEAPAGETTVVLGPGWPGVMLHEAVGHGLEADFNRKKPSAFSDRIGELVASPLCTVVDDGTIDSRRGSLNVDDEGNPTQRNVLIENGVLTRLSAGQLSSRIMGARPHRQRAAGELRTHSPCRA